VDAVVDLCDLTGGVRHVAVGTDFDGGQGAESAPLGIETIADLPRLGDALVARGFSDDEAAAVLGGNWLRWLRETMPA
jgi:membrane dipeptidase